MNITQITNRAGAKKKRKRVGRGESSGHGKTSCRGNKGQKSRSGSKPGNVAEGGALPFFRRLPKFGFSNVQFRQEYQVINVGDLSECFENGAHVTSAALEEKGLIRNREGLVKVLGDGEMQKKLSVEAHRFSGSAESKIAGAGGSVTWINPKPKKKFVRRPKVSEEKQTEGQGATAATAEGEKAEKPKKKKEKTADGHSKSE